MHARVVFANNQSSVADSATLPFKVGRTTGMRTSCWETWPVSRPRPPCCLLPTFKQGTERQTSFDGRSCRSAAVMRNSLEEGADVNAWSIRTWTRTTGGRAEFAGRLRLTCECSSVSCMEHGALFLFVARLYVYTTFADLRWEYSERCSRFSVSR